jgi:hypothetical protein
MARIVSESDKLLSGGGDDPQGRGTQYLYWCIGCEEYHQIIVGPSAWGFNGDQDNPTVEGSVLVHGPQRSTPAKPEGVCHSFIRDGRIEYLADSTHALAGQTVGMITVGVAASQLAAKSSKNPETSNR